MDRSGGGRSSGRFRVLEGGRTQLRSLPRQTQRPSPPRPRVRVPWVTYAAMTVWLALYFAWPTRQTDGIALVVDLIALYAIGILAEPLAGTAAALFLVVLGILSAGFAHWLLRLQGIHFLIIGVLAASTGGLLLEALRRPRPRWEFTLRAGGPLLLDLGLTWSLRPGAIWLALAAIVVGAWFWALVVGAPPGWSGHGGERSPTWLFRLGRSPESPARSRRQH